MCGGRLGLGAGGKLGAGAGMACEDGGTGFLIACCCAIIRRRLLMSGVSTGEGTAPSGGVEDAGRG